METNIGAKSGGLRAWLGRWSVYGDHWSRLQAWGVRQCPVFLEPIVLAGWTLIFWIACRRQRVAVCSNLGIVLPGSSSVMNGFRSLRVFWNFSCCLTDALRSRETPGGIDWTIRGVESFRELAELKGGAIVLTAHMGNYDVAAPVFAERFGRKFHAVRAPERRQKTQEYLARARAADESAAFEVRYNEDGGMLGIELARLLAAGEVVALQGDRVLFDVAPLETKMNGVGVRLPKGPFALAQVSRCPVYPLFVARTGWRRYEIHVGEAFRCERTRDRARALEQMAETWSGLLASAAGAFWFQWFVFEPVAVDG